MTRSTATFLTAIAGTALLAACADSPVAPDAGAPISANAVAGAEIIDNVNRIEDATFVEFVSCANGGFGEVVSAAGRLHITGSIVRDGAGNLHAQFSANTQNFVGVGTITGDTYRVSGGSRENVRVGTTGPLPAVWMFTDVIRFTGTGNGVQFRTELTLRLVADANGQLRVDEMTFSSSCG